MTREEALQRKESMRAKALRDAQSRTDALHEQLPLLCELDQKLAAIGPSFVQAAIRGDQSAQEQLLAQKDLLQKQRADFLTANGLRPDEDKPVFACPKCEDTGYVVLRLCDCVKSMMYSERYRSAGLGRGVFDKSFDNFSLSYYGPKDAETMGRILRICRNYASSFTKDSQSMLFIGKTGLGKTHLSAAVAGEVAHKGYSVLYESAQSLFDSYEHARFGTIDEAVDRVKEYETCDLLLIDDLGSESSSQYTSACFFNLLNLRLISGSPTIISTNLNNAALEKTYGERILSRLLGEYRVLEFAGQDIRMKKVLEER